MFGQVTRSIGQKAIEKKVETCLRSLNWKRLRRGAVNARALIMRNLVQSSYAAPDFSDCQRC